MAAKAAARKHTTKQTGIAAVMEPGTLVWIPDTETAEVWVRAEVESADVRSSSVRVKTQGGSVRSVALDQLLRCNTDAKKAENRLTEVSDLSALTHLNEPEVLRALQLRFEMDKIYTFCGQSSPWSILIVLNPFKLMPGLYDSFPPAEAPEHEEPHIFSVARRAFESLTRKLQSNVVLISGESGAGKTESTKHVLKFLTTQIAKGQSTPGSSANQTLKKLMCSNPLLEAFGNACTTRNDNSSRFGKFMELQFEAKGQEAKFMCAAIDTYLLEKVRITEVQKLERSYHIFYQACAARKKLGDNWQGLPLHLFRSPQDFVYLNKSDRFELDDNDEAELFQETMQAMESMGISTDERTQIIRLVAAVLHIGNIPIRDEEELLWIPEDDVSFQLVTELLGIEPARLATALTHHLRTVRSEDIHSPVTLSKAKALRESLARAVYSLLFNFLVHRVNTALAGGAEGLRGKRLFAGVLDLFGFEHFEKNSFEQLCINFANERLQQFFNQFVFKTEMHFYQEEGLQCDLMTEFPDNQDVIDLIQAKHCSIFALLDEECRVPKGSDQALAQKLAKTFGGQHQRFKAERKKPDSFCVIHFAGAVTYDTAHFIEKNMDELGELLKQAMESSTAPLMVSVMSLKREAVKTGAGGGGTLKPSTACTEYMGQLNTLMSKLDSAQPHFVRCIRPNPEKQPNRYDRQSVVEQLRSGGVVEALYVQRVGFPCHWTHEECWENISIMLESAQCCQLNKMEISERIGLALSKLAKQLRWSAAAGSCFAIGESRVFFKQAPFEALESHRMLVLRTACFLQANIRRVLVRQRLWAGMEPEARRRSLLFKSVFKQPKTEEAPRHSPAVEEEEEKDGEEDLDNHEPAAPPCVTAEVENPEQDPGNHEPAAPPGVTVKLESREQAPIVEQLVEEETKKLRNAMAKVVEEGEQKLEDLRKAMIIKQEEECRRVILRVQEEEASKRRQVESRLQKCEEQVALAEKRGQEAAHRAEELERENARLTLYSTGPEQLRQELQLVQQDFAQQQQAKDDAIKSLQAAVADLRTATQAGSSTGGATSHAAENLCRRELRDLQAQLNDLRDLTALPGRSEEERTEEATRCARLEQLCASTRQQLVSTQRDLATLRNEVLDLRDQITQ